MCDVLSGGTREESAARETACAGYRTHWPRFFNTREVHTAAVYSRSRAAAGPVVLRRHFSFRFEICLIELETKVRGTSHNGINHAMVGMRQASRVTPHMLHVMRGAREVSGVNGRRPRRRVRGEVNELLADLRKVAHKDGS